MSRMQTRPIGHSERKHGAHESEALVPRREADDLVGEPNRLQPREVFEDRLDEQVGTAQAIRRFRDLDMPVTVSGKYESNSIHGKLNGGGSLLSIKTGDGSVRVGKS